MVVAGLGGIGVMKLGELFIGFGLPPQLPLQKELIIFAGDQWGKKDINFLTDPNGELKKVTYSLDRNSPDWPTWQKRCSEFQLGIISREN